MEEGGSNDTFFRDILRSLAYGAAFATVPLIVSMRDLQPPWWPDGITYAASALMLVVALIARGLAPDLSRNMARAMLLLAASFTIAGLAAYLYLYAEFVLPIGSGERVILGYECNEITLRVYDGQCPDFNADDLAEAEFKPERLYSEDSLDDARLWLLGAWLAFLVGLMAAVAWAVAGRRLAQSQLQT